MGFSVKCVSLKKLHGLLLVLYLCMGWLSILIIRTLIASMTTAGFAFLIAGGLFYSSGVIFYLLAFVRHGRQHHAFFYGDPALLISLFTAKTR